MQDSSPSAHLLWSFSFVQLSSRVHTKDTMALKLLLSDTCSLNNCIIKLLQFVSFWNKHQMSYLTAKFGAEYPCMSLDSSSPRPLCVSVTQSKDWMWSNSTGVCDLESWNTQDDGGEEQRAVRHEGKLPVCQLWHRNLFMMHRNQHPSSQNSILYTVKRLRRDSWYLLETISAALCWNQSA